MDQLVDAIIERLVPDPPSPGSAVPFRGDQLEALAGARCTLLEGDRAAAAVRLNGMIHGS
jgi:hypothetical protein